MSWSVTHFFIFLFIYTSDGSPLGDRPPSEGLKTIRFIPSQWGKDSEISYHWPKGEVPYFFDNKTYDGVIKSRVHIAMAALERDSCIRFKEEKEKPQENSGSWLHFTNPRAQRRCFHESSYQANGEIEVVLGYDCLKQRDIMHSVMHGIGFRDEVSHPQRDLFVKILWGNIQPAYRAMFRIQPVEHTAGLVEYDPMSIMHFHDRAFSVNGQATIAPLLPGLKINPSDDLSHLDKMKLRIMFGHECNKRKVGEVLDTCEGIFSEFLRPSGSNGTNGSQNKSDVEQVIIVGHQNDGSENDNLNENSAVGNIDNVETTNKEALMSKIKNEHNNDVPTEQDNYSSDDESKNTVTSSDEDKDSYENKNENYNKNEAEEFDNGNQIENGNQDDKDKRSNENENTSHDYDENETDELNNDSKNDSNVEKDNKINEKEVIIVGFNEDKDEINIENAKGDDM